MAAASAAGVTIDISSSKALADSLDLAVKEHDPYFNKLLRIMSTRCMMPAQYFCSGEYSKGQWHHYGLAAPVYTHFTSPIRRYADVIVHRLLAAAIGVIPLPIGNADRQRQQELCSHLNRRHKAAQHVQRASVNLHTLLFFKSKPSEETAYVMSITTDTIVVLAPRFGIEGQINMIDLVNILQCKPQFDSNYHRVSFDTNQGKDHNDDRAGSTNDITPFTIEIFQQVNVLIKVEHENTPNRCLSLQLIHPRLNSKPTINSPHIMKKRNITASQSSDKTISSVLSKKSNTKKKRNK